MRKLVLVIIHQQQAQFFITILDTAMANYILGWEYFLTTILLGSCEGMRRAEDRLILCTYEIMTYLPCFDRTRDCDMTRASYVYIVHITSHNDKHSPSFSKAARFHSI